MTEPSLSTSTWSDDYLQRKAEATYLAGYLAARYQVKKYEAGFVLAVNADWGMGKSFMLDRWSKDTEASGHPVIRFNAWENDFTAEPLVAFIAEIDRALEPYFEKIPAVQRLKDEWLKKAKAILIPTLKIVGLAALKHGAGVGYDKLSEIYNPQDDDNSDNESFLEGDSNAGEDDDEDEKKFDLKSVQEKLSKAVEEKLKEHNNTRDAIKGFKEKFAAIIEQLERTDIQLPIYVFIDELDRCRPDYAIKLLEGIKHLFGISGLYFVVATNISELAHSVRAVYGAGFSSERYLKRFFDMEYSLPESNGNNFAKQIMSPLAELVVHPFVTGFEQILNANDLPLKGLPYIFEHYAEAFELSLRDQHQTTRILETAIITLNRSRIHIHFLIFLAVLYQKSSAVYRNVVSAYSLTEPTGFQKVFPANGRGIFKFKIWDGDTHRAKSATTVEVAQVYFNSLTSDNASARSYGSDDFPKNLQRELFTSGTKVEDIKKYIDIVRRAGNFAK